MKTRNKKLRTKTRNKTQNRKTTRKMKGGSFLTNFWNRISGSENKQLNEDLKKFSIEKETIRKTMQSMYDTAKDSTKFNANYASFTETVTNINKLVTDINKHRSNPTTPNPKPANTNPKPSNTNPNPNPKPANTTPSLNPNPNPNPTNPIGATDVIGGVGAAAGAGLAIKELTNEMGKS